MNKKLKELTPQQYKKYNGQSIMLAFKSLSNEATLDDLSQYIAQSIGKTEELVRGEVINVLNRGIDDGFILKRGEHYVLAGKDDYQMDCKLRDQQSEADNKPKLLTQAEELEELKERQELRNELELSLYKMTTEELRKMHSIYVKKSEYVESGN